MVGLCIVTLGLYWFYWMWRSYAEVHESRHGTRWPATGPLLLLAVYVVGTVLAHWPADEAPKTLTELRALQEGRQTYRELVTMLLVGLQFFYLVSVQRRLDEVVSETSLVSRSRPTLLYAFTLLVVLSWLPLVGGLLELAGLILALFWIKDFQWTINQYWDWAMLGPTRGNLVPPAARWASPLPTSGTVPTFQPDSGPRG